jgi:hypothetical protein
MLGFQIPGLLIKAVEQCRWLDDAVAVWGAENGILPSQRDKAKAIGF